MHWLSAILFCAGMTYGYDPKHTTRSPVVSIHLYQREMRCNCYKFAAVVALFAILVVLVTPVEDELPCSPRQIHCAILVFASNSLLSLSQTIFPKVPKPSGMLSLAGSPDVLSFNCAPAFARALWLQVCPDRVLRSSRDVVN